MARRGSGNGAGMDFGDPDAPLARIVILADGTGNAFGRHGSNIWRLGKALDQTLPDQVVVYVPGVGTSRIRAWAALDGATGFGVPANVRDLYEYLCRNWRPGVDLYLFGFSRGAFTVRTLAGLIGSEGLVPCSGPDGPLSRGELRRLVAAAWRSYRAKDPAWERGAPTIALARTIRDALLGVRDRLQRGRTYAAARGGMAGERRNVPIHFVGAFDTVEAFGVPVEPMRRWIDALVWPISFRNGVVGPTVHRARHALALDDERTTFHPVRFDAQAAPDDPDRIREVWFAGVHSDVGGGYQEDGTALVPLLWMIGEARASKTPQHRGLRFVPGSIEAMRLAATPYGPTHDSRAGAAVFYRYAPRDLLASDPATPPVIHHSVAERMVFGARGYVPLTLPTTAHVLMPDGSIRVIEGFESAGRPEAAGPQGPPFPELAVERLSKPDGGYAELARDGIWLRGKAQLGLLASVAFAAVLPWTAPAIDAVLGRALGALLPPAGPALISDWAEHASLPGFADRLGGLVPGYVRPWTDVALREPLLAVPAIAVALWLWLVNGRLRDGIADDATRAWFGTGTVPPTGERSPAPDATGWRRLARWRRGRSEGWKRV